MSAERARKMAGGATDGFGNTDFEAETYEQFLVLALDAQGMAEFMNGDSAKAIELSRECIVLFPKGEEYAGRSALYEGRL